MATATNWQRVVKHIVEHAGITQGKLALKCGVSQQTISNIKKNIRGPGIRVRSVLRSTLVDLNVDPKQFEETISDLMSDSGIKKMLASLERADNIKRAQVVATVLEMLK